MKKGMIRTLSVALLVCGCVLPVFPQTAQAQAQEGAKERVSYFHDIVIEKGETAHVLTCLFCSVIVRGQVKGDAVSVWGNIEIEGRVEGDAVAAGGKIILRGEATAEGDLVAVGGRVERRGSGDIKADVNEVPYIYLPGQRNWVFPGTPIFVACHIIFSMLYIIAGRARVERLAETARGRGLVSFLTGVVVMSALVAAFLWASDLEKYDNEALLAVWLVIMLLVLPGIAGVSLALGRRLRHDAGVAIAICVGALILTLLTLLPLAGLVVFGIVWVIALGATLVGRFGFARTRAVAAAVVSSE